jgi:hypothetical protein
MRGAAILSIARVPLGVGASGVTHNRCVSEYAPTGKLVALAPEVVARVRDYFAWKRDKPMSAWLDLLPAHIAARFRPSIRRAA